jgi:deaminated glutathione amidase
VPITVAVAQFAAGPSPEDNLVEIERLVLAAVARGAELVVLPEYSMAFDPKGDQRTFAQPLDGPFTAAFGELARRHGVTLVAGMTETLDADRASNTLVTVSPTGDRLAVYRKVHLYDAFGYRESDQLRGAAVTAPETWEAADLTFGAMTCYDLRFPESARWLVDAGADVLVVPAAWASGPAKEDHWVTLNRARAIENTAFVLAAGQTGPACTGQSLVLDPMGVVLAAAGEAPGIAVADLDVVRLHQVRTRNPSLTNRRFDVRPRRETASER